MQNDLRGYVDLWNEDELKFKFIAPFISLIGYNTKQFQAFTQRSLTAIVNNIKLTGRVDFLVTTGKSKPIQPFFFLHEYKKTRGRENGPIAQLLAEMIAAQELNHHAFPLYGCYIIGRNWYFVLLQGSSMLKANNSPPSTVRIFGHSFLFCAKQKTSSQTLQNNLPEII